MMNGQLMILATWGSRRGARSVQEYDELRRRQLIDSGGYTMEQMDTGLEMDDSWDDGLIDMLVDGLKVHFKN